MPFCHFLFPSYVRYTLTVLGLHIKIHPENKWDVYIIVHSNMPDLYSGGRRCVPRLQCKELYHRQAVLWYLFVMLQVLFMQWLRYIVSHPLFF